MLGALSRLSWPQLNRHIISCKRCPRLRDHCRAIAKAKRKAYLDWDYWGKPVPNFGSVRASVLIVGLAPGAHGANRTGRMFTGDRSGEWLYRALYKAGFANQPNSDHLQDGLELVECAITAVCHCAPPNNRPTAEEVGHCSSWLQETIRVTQPSVCVALGQLAWKAVFGYARQQGIAPKPAPKFAHAAETTFNNGVVVLGSYHPSQQNTFTGRLTEPMLDAVFSRARQLMDTRKDAT